MLKVLHEVAHSGILWDWFVQDVVEGECDRFFLLTENATPFQTPPEDRKPEFPVPPEIPQFVCLHWAFCGGEKMVQSGHSRRWEKYFQYDGKLRNGLGPKLLS